MKSKSILSILLCIVMLCTLVLGACNSKSSVNKQGSTADESTASQSTKDEQSVHTTATVAETTEALEKTSEEATTTAPAETTTAPAQNKPAQNKPAQNNQKPANKPTQNNNNNSGSTETKPMTCVVTVGDKDYTANYGDILTYTYYVKTPKKVECIQASVNYTPDCLQLVEDNIEKQLPVIHSGAIINGNMQGVVNYNSINLSGFDFTQEGVLITLRFKVIFGGSGSIVNAIEFMDEKGGEVSYVDSFKMSKDISFREVLK